MSALTVDAQRLTVTFDTFGLEDYQLFLRTKAIPESQLAYSWETDTYTVTAPARFAPMLGAREVVAETDRLPLPEHLFDYQRWVVGLALDSKRFAAWIDTGLGKTLVILEWCRQVQHLTGGRVLIVEPLNVISQFLEMASRFYPNMAIDRLESPEAVRAWAVLPGQGLAITNPQKFIGGPMAEMHYLTGVAVDESSILKTGAGVIKWNLIKSCRGIEYKLSCTATPAPNDAMEYASQASWLETIRHEGDVLWTYYSKDRAGNWYIKPHAKEAFYRFMATWSVYMRDPAHFGFADILSTLPPPDIREYRVPITDTQTQLMQTLAVQNGTGLFNDRLGVKERGKLSQLAKGFQYTQVKGKREITLLPSEKPRFVADLVRKDAAEGLQVLVWTVFDAESEILHTELQGLDVATLDGGMSEAARAEVLERFRLGTLQILISKPSLIGFGMNLQHCRSMVFSGFDDSFERMYQAIRRCYRFGQTETVRVHVPYIPELEGMMFDNIRAKEAAFMRDVAIQEKHYREALGL